jgi:hypothetical protein
MRQQVVRKSNRLSVLEVSAARHCYAEVLLRSRDQDLNEFGNQLGNHGGLVKKVGADQGCNLVVATATGTDLAAKFNTGNFDKSALKRRVNILVGLLGNKATLYDAVVEFNEASVKLLVLGDG